MGTDSEYLTAGDAAEIIGVTSQSVRVAANTGRLKIAAMTPNGWRLFLRADVEQFAKDRRASS